MEIHPTEDGRYILIVTRNQLRELAIGNGHLSVRVAEKGSYDLKGLTKAEFEANGRTVFYHALIDALPDEDLTEGGRRARKAKQDGTREDCPF